MILTRQEKKKQILDCIIKVKTYKEIAEIVRVSPRDIKPGPNIDLAIKLIRRMKKLFQDKLDVTFDSKKTVLELDGCSIEAYPSNYIDGFHSLTNPKFIFIDEGDLCQSSKAHICCSKQNG